MAWPVAALGNPPTSSAVRTITGDKRPALAV
jgi:hypothetical protein